jgi:hypothetical protein
MQIDYNKLREIFQRDNAAKEYFYPKDERNSIWKDIAEEFSKLESRAERNEYLGIIANANGVLSIKERKEVLNRFKDTYYHSLLTPSILAGGNPLPISLSLDDYNFIKSAFLRSQEAQFTKTAREQTAQKLKELHKDGMSLEGRKAYLVETAKNTYPLKKKGKGDAIIHRTLKEKSKLQRLKKFLTRTK